jgi:hypothetical protein
MKKSNATADPRRGAAAQSNGNIDEAGPVTATSNAKSDKVDEANAALKGKAARAAAPNRQAARTAASKGKTLWPARRITLLRLLE